MQGLTHLSRLWGMLVLPMRNKCAGHAASRRSVLLFTSACGTDTCRCAGMQRSDSRRWQDWISAGCLAWEGAESSHSTASSRVARMHVQSFVSAWHLQHMAGNEEAQEGRGLQEAVQCIQWPACHQVKSQRRFPFPLWE